jgi:hypothetical protein
MRFVCDLYRHSESVLHIVIIGSLPSVDHLLQDLIVKRKLKGDFMLDTVRSQNQATI